MKPTETFETLPLPKRELPQWTASNYRVYKNVNEYVVIEASTALEAMQASGVTPVYKIERDGLNYITVLEPNTWKTEPAAEAQAIPAEAATPAAAEAAPAQAPVPETPLSNDDVNKLLNT